MWRNVGRGTLWVLAVLMVSAGGSLIHAAFTSYHEPIEMFLGLVCLLTGTAIYWHALRYPSW
jgi:hypothetical protein